MLSTPRRCRMAFGPRERGSHETAAGRACWPICTDQRMAYDLGKEGATRLWTLCEKERSAPPGFRRVNAYRETFEFRFSASPSRRTAAAVTARWRWFGAPRGPSGWQFLPEGSRVALWFASFFVSRDLTRRRSLRGSACIYRPTLAASVGAAITSSPR